MKHVPHLLWRPFALVLILLMLPRIGESQVQFRQPQPGDVYREYVHLMNNSDGREYVVIDETSPYFTTPNPDIHLTIGDLQSATRAEAVMTVWGGHVGTTDKRFRFNGNAWISIPELDGSNGIPSGHQGYNYMQQEMVVLDVPLAYLHEGDNTFKGFSGPQVPPHGWNWGQWGWYMMMIRVYYDAGSKSHPTGSITSPSGGGTVGENPTITATASGGSGIAQVDFLAYYDGYDTDGDGIYQQYHGDYHIAEKVVPTNLLQNHAGTVYSSPYQVSWNTQWVPDQAAGSVKLIARIKDNSGIWYVTPEVTNLTFQRSSGSVRLYKPQNVPEQYWVQEGRTASSTFTIPGGDNLSDATAATLDIRTWNGINQDGGTDYYGTLNGHTFTPPPFGAGHYYSFDVLSEPLSWVQNGTNTIVYYAAIVGHHGIEVLWPGPALTVRYGGAPVTTPPSITAQPADQTVGEGETATFSVGASGSAPLSYQWQKNSSAITGATGSSYTTPATTPGDSGALFRCVVSNSAGTATSNAAILHVVRQAPQIVTHPVPQTVEVGQTATFGVVASGAVPLSYQWQKDAVVIGGATGSSYTTPPALRADSGASFRCVVTNAYGSATSNAATLTVITLPPSITTHPASQVVAVGQTATFTVAASGTAPLVYQWQKNNADVPGATAASYTTPAAALGDNGSTFRCAVTNSAGSATSNAATLTVGNFPPTVTKQPSFLVVVAGATATFDIEATGPGPLTYRWQKGGADIPGATSSSYTTPGTVLADNGTTFRCIVTNAFGTAKSASATLSVLTASPSILQNPGFESGTVPWGFYTDGVGTFANDTTGPSSPHAARITIAAGGTNVQLYQAGLTLEPATQYTLSFKAFSSSGHDVSVTLQKHTSPYTGYGLVDHVFDLTTGWSTYTVQFLTEGFTGTVTDGRLMFWLAPYDEAGDRYYIDDVMLTNAVLVDPPLISAGPLPQTVGVGETAAFTVEATGPAPLGYQWQKDEVTIGGATSATYTTPAVVMGDSGAIFRCIVTNAGGSATSAGALLRVAGAAPAITAHPGDQTVTEGATATFTVTAVGSMPLSYQWQKNDADIAGALGATYITPPTTLADSGATFRCVVSNSVGAITSNDAVLHVRPTTDVAEGGIPASFVLTQNYPNPFNPSTTILYGIPAGGVVTLRLYNLLGQSVRTLVEGWQPAGYHTVVLDASELSSGVYFYRIHSGTFLDTKRLAIVK